MKNSKNNIQLDSDEKVGVKKAINIMGGAYTRLYNLLEKNELTEATSEELLERIENHFSIIARNLKYKSYSMQEREERYFEIRKANARIRELEEQLRMRDED